MSLDLLLFIIMAICKGFIDSVRGSLRAKLTLGAILPLMVILFLFTTIQYRQHQEIILTNLSSMASQSGRVIESSLRNAMLNANFSEAQIILDTIGASKEFRVIYLLNTDGKVIFAPNSLGVGRQLNNKQPDCQPCHRLAPNERPSSVIVTADDGQRVFRSMYPIKNATECSVCHGPNKQLIGLLLTDIPVAPLEAGLMKGFQENILWWGGTIIVTILIINLALDRIIIQRLARLVRSISHFGQDRTDVRLPVGDPDEIGKLTQAYNAMEQRIADEAEENRSLSDRLQRQNVLRGELLKHLITAQENERKRVSREIHDDFGQALGALSLQIQLLERLIATDADSVISQINQTQILINETTERMYDLILALRPSALDDLGLVTALRSHAERALDGSGMQFDLNVDGLSDRRLPADLETALYRIFQEALSNIRRHSCAKQVRITLSLQDTMFVGEIVDDGIGFDIQSIDISEGNPRGLGLLSIQERVEQYCGQVEIISQPGAGTRISLQLPIFEVDHE